jgi:N-acetylmuramoyl-L-alanine amidase
VKRISILAVLMIGCCSASAADLALDIGHTIKKPGSMSASGVSEFMFNQQLVQELVPYLGKAGIQVNVINGDGRISSLSERTAQSAKDHLFVSIHHDSVQPQFIPVVDQRFRGFSLWVSHKNPHYLESARCAALVADDLIQSGFTPSHYHTDAIPGENRMAVDDSRGIFANDDLIVLKTARSPAILIEAGVIVNPVEEAWLRSPSITASQAQAIARGLHRCMGKTYVHHEGLIEIGAKTGMARFGF